MAKKKTVLQRMGDSIKRGGKAAADVAQAALSSSSDFHTETDIKPVRGQRWAKEIEATGPKKRKAPAAKKRR
jgi:hypothetical protein